MKMRKKWALGLLALCLSLCACGADNAAPPEPDEPPAQTAAAAEPLEFQSGSGSFSVRIPDVEGGWTQSDGGNDEHLVLDNADRSFSILVQGLPKDSEQFQSLDGLIEFYRDQALSSFGEPTAETVAVGPGLTAKAESYAVKQDGLTAKALVVFLEGENGYYVYTITGLEEPYDANIGAQREAVANFSEYAE